MFYRQRYKSMIDNYLGHGVSWPPVLNINQGWVFGPFWLNFHFVHPLSNLEYLGSSPSSISDPNILICASWETQQVMAYRTEFLPLTWETQIELLALNFRLATPQLLWTFGEWKSRRKLSVFLFLFLSFSAPEISKLEFFTKSKFHHLLAVWLWAGCLPFWATVPSCVWWDDNSTFMLLSPALWGLSRRFSDNACEALDS